MENNNIYILNLEGSHILKATKRDSKKGYTDKYTNKEGKTVKTPFRSLYGGSLTSSMTMDILIEKGLKIKSTIINETNYTYTNDIINVKFNYTYGKMNIEEVRQQLYNNGFKFNGKEYIQFQRTSSKSRGGSDLFIQKRLYKEITNITNCGLEFKETDELDIASCRAYQALTFSENKSYVTINPNEILLVDDIEKEIYDDCYVTTWNEALKQTETKLIKNYKIKNKIFDGESLMESSLFDGEGCKLLRNFWFKSNASNTNIQLFFKSHKDLIKDGKVYDMFGRKLNVDDIKLITTPSSIKFLKLTEFKFNGDMKKCYEYWLEHITSNFGVCMSEEESSFAPYNQLSYQMINSMNLTKDEIRSLCKDEFKYILDMKNNIDVFRKHISAYDMSNSRKMIYNVLAQNDRVEGTELFKQFKNNQINQYKEMLGRGKIKIEDTDYSVCVGNVMELLYWALGKDITNDNQYLGEGEVYCSRYATGEKVCIIRNPHICTNNLFYAQIKWHEDFDLYFNYTDNIIILDSIHNNILQRENGLDFDIDKVLISPVLAPKAKEAMKYPTPVNAIESSLVPRAWTVGNLANVDSKIAKGKSILGEIVNLSQEIQSYYWDEYSKGEKADQEYLTFLNKTCCTLANISNIAIDSAKKTFPKKLNLDSELDRIRAIKYNGKRLFKYILLPNEFKINDDGYVVNVTNQKIDKTFEEVETITEEQKKNYELIRIKPLFFRDIVKTNKKIKNKHYYYKYMNCPMNYIHDVLREHQTGVKRVSSFDIMQLIDFNVIDVKRANRHQIEDMKNKIDELKKELKKNDDDYDNAQDSKAQAEIIRARKLIKDSYEQWFKSKIISVETLASIFRKIYGDKKISKEVRANGLKLISFIYATHTDLFIKLFKNNNSIIMKLIPVEEETNIQIWKKNYKRSYIINTIQEKGTTIRTIKVEGKQIKMEMINI